MLQQRYDEGGSINLFTATGDPVKSNMDIYDAWTQFTAKLVASDTGFADLYARWLDNDSLERVTVSREDLS